MDAQAAARPRVVAPPLSWNEPAGPPGTLADVLRREAAPPPQKALTGRVIDSGGPDIEQDGCDRAAIARMVKRNLRAIQSCYERELKRNQNLRGKLVVRFTIAKTGRVQGKPEVEEETLRNEAVVSCVRNTIRMWMFPLKSDDECVVRYPFVFAPAS